jgi:ribosomal protein S18 acetylase RimI-like enzyme
MNNKVRLIKEDDIDAAATSLAAAFMKDPLQSYTFPDEQERKEKSPAHFKAFLQYGLKFGDVYTINETAGAAVWLRPNETDVTPEKAEEGGLTKLPQLLGEEAAGRFFSTLEFISPFHEQDVPEPHWYLMVVGVHPDFCGKGFGKSLLEPVIKKAETNGEPVYLETAQPGNISFYEKLGFRVIRELVDPTSKLKMWTFIKG